VASLTEEGCLNRQKRLWAQLPTTVSWALVCNPRNVTYLSGFCTKPHSFSAGFCPWLLLIRPRTSILIGDKTTLQANEGPYFSSENIAYDWNDGVNTATNRHKANLAAFSQVIDRVKDSHGATEGDAFPLSGIQHLSLANLIKRDLGENIRKIRRKKDADEIEILKACARAGEAGHAAAIEAVKPGATEFDVYHAVQSAATATAGRPCVIYGDFRANTPSDIIASGGPSDRILEDGGLFILDLSVIINGYRLNFANTYSIGAAPSPDQIGAMVACKFSLEAGEKLIRPGTPCKDIHNKISEILKIAYFDELALQAGHGVGLAHPESPTIASESTDILEEGNVISLESSVFRDGIGAMLIERSYLVTESGYEILSNHKIDLG